jgi:photosystem II stability/assembly factor-like uncharacterized protein
MLRYLKKFRRLKKVLVVVLTSTSPILIIGGLLYAVFFVKAGAVSRSVEANAIERRDNYFSIATPDTHIVWAAGSNGKVVRSDDAGKSWKRQLTPTESNLQGLAAWDAQRAVAVGNKGVIIITGDGGATWSQAQVPESANPNKLFRVRIFDDTAWAVGEFHTLLRSTDHGATWTRALPEKDSALNNVFFLGAQGWLVGEFGTVMKSSDGGAVWSPVTSSNKVSLMAVAFRDPQHGVAVGLSGTVMSSNDGGASWIQAPNVTKEHLYSVIWDEDRWVAVGDKGMMVSAGPDAAHWSAARISSNDVSWHTQIAKSGPRYFLAGAHLAVLEHHELSVVGRAPN